MWASVEVTPVSPDSWLRPFAQACCLWNGSGFSCCRLRILTLPPSRCHPSPPVLSSTFSFCSFAPWRSWSSAWTLQRNCGTDALLRRPLLHPQKLYLPRLPWHWPSDEGQTDKKEDEHKAKNHREVLLVMCMYLCTCASSCCFFSCSSIALNSASFCSASSMVAWFCSS